MATGLAIVLTRMNRRVFLCGLTLGTLFAPLAVWGQQAGKVYRVGFLGRSADSAGPWLQAFLARMREHGWIENQNFVAESRYTEGRSETLGAIAKELVERNVDVIVVMNTEAAIAAKQVTSTVPIVMANPGDPVGTGLVASLARPGGNVTGLSFQGTELAGKQLDLLKEAFPRLLRVAVLVNPTNASHAPRVRQAQIAARTLKLQLDVVEASRPDELDTAFMTIAKRKAGAVLVLADGMFRAEMSRFGSQVRLPAMYGLREHVLAGGLMSYGASFTDLFRHAADYVDKILKGAKPADLPVEQPTKFELVINLKTARALGITVPHSLLLRADEVIQ